MPATRDPEGTPSRRRGRPRDAGADAAILAAGTELLLSAGHQGFSLEQVATRARVARTTVYRRFPTRAHLIIGVVSSLQQEALLPDTGDVRRDLLELLRSIVAVIARPAMVQLLGELVAAAVGDPEVGESFRRLWADRRAAAFAVLRRAGWSDPAIVVDQLAGPIYYRALITGDPLDDRYLERLIAAALPGSQAEPERVHPQPAGDAPAKGT